MNSNSAVKSYPALRWLVPLIAILAAVASGAGLFLQGGPGPRTFTTLHGQEVEIYGQGVYQNDTTLFAAGFRGADAIVLFAGLPLLAISFSLYRRGSLRGAFLLAGALSYFLYIGLSLLFSAMFNRLFFVYAALLSASLFAFIIAITAFDLHSLPRRVSPRLPHRGTAALLFIAGLGTLGLWLSELVGPILSGGAPVNLGPYTTMFTHGLDSATITPVAVLAGICLLRRKPLGYLLAPPVLVLCLLNGLNVLAATVSQTLAGIRFPPGVYVGMVGSWIVMGLFAAWFLAAFFRNLEETAAPTELVSATKPL
jgi:hypothetical protein